MEMRFQKMGYQLIIAGIILFMLLYVIAAAYYPGGSQQNLHSIGFSWRDNYWCNLLDTMAMNGQFNDAKPIATVALFLLSVTLGLFWYVFPLSVPMPLMVRIVIQISGILSMLVVVFLLSGVAHDGIINAATLLGLIATSGTLYGLYIRRLIFYVGWGLLNFVSVAVNAIVYYEKSSLYLLPLIQKFSFVLFLGLIMGICVTMLRTSKLN